MGTDFRGFAAFDRPRGGAVLRLAEILYRRHDVRWTQGMMESWMDKKPKKRPNILLLMTDQMRADALGCRGLTPTRTPNLDSLALEGTVYTNCATVSPICAPARAALLAGLYPHQMGIW
ncbi:MAG: hypothetical protein CVV52_14320, partial [Spirochaetae bacterium HGW-Spirochaetae-8]